MIMKIIRKIIKSRKKPFLQYKGSNKVGRGNIKNDIEKAWKHRSEELNLRYLNN